MAMDDSIPEERERGIKNDTYLIKEGFIDELRLYGDRVSNDMQAEASLATRCNIPVVDFTHKTP